MLLRTITCCVAVALASIHLLAGEPTMCPDAIQVHQQLAAPINGWTALLDDAPHQLAGITFYDGRPEEKASLAYDEMKKAGSKQIATWTFTTQPGRATWIACSYSGTAVQLTRSLPRTTTRCEVTYNPRQQVCGLPQIEKIVCR